MLLVFQLIASFVGRVNQDVVGFSTNYFICWKGKSDVVGFSANCFICWKGKSDDLLFLYIVPVRSSGCVIEIWGTFGAYIR